MLTFPYGNIGKGSPLVPAFPLLPIILLVSLVDADCLLPALGTNVAVYLHSLHLPDHVVIPPLPGAISIDPF